MLCVRRASNAATRLHPSGALRDPWAFRRNTKYFLRSLLVNHLRSTGASGNSQNASAKSRRHSSASRYRASISDVFLATSSSRGRITRSRLVATAEMPEAFASKIDRSLTLPLFDFCDDAELAEGRVFAQKCMQLRVGLELLDPATLHEPLHLDPTIAGSHNGSVFLELSRVHSKVICRCSRTHVSSEKCFSLLGAASDPQGHHQWSFIL